MSGSGYPRINHNVNLTQYKKSNLLKTINPGIFAEKPQNKQKSDLLGLVQYLGQPNLKEALHINSDFLPLLSIFCHC